MQLKSQKISNMKAYKKSQKQQSLLAETSYEQHQKGLSQPLSTYLPQRHAQSVAKVRQIKQSQQNGDEGRAV